MKAHVHASFLSFILALTHIAFQIDWLSLGLSEYLSIMCLSEVICGSTRHVQCLPCLQQPVYYCNLVFKILQLQIYFSQKSSAAYCCIVYVLLHKATRRNWNGSRQRIAYEIQHSACYIYMKQLCFCRNI